MFDTMSFLWKMARTNIPYPKITKQQFDSLPPPLCNFLLEKGYLVKSQTNAGFIPVNEDTFEVVQTRYSDRSIRFFYHDNGIPYEVDAEQLIQYEVCFDPFTELLNTGLGCNAGTEELITGHLWKIGTAGQQRREVYLVRNWKKNISIQQFLDKVKQSSLIFQLGTIMQPTRFNENQVYNIEDMVDWNESEKNFILDAEVIWSNLRDMYAARPTKERKKNQPKWVEYQQAAEKMLVSWFIYKYENEKRMRSNQNPLKPSINLQFDNQKTFAKELKIPESEISRMLERWDNNLVGNGYIYKKLMQLLKKSKNDSFIFIDFYNEHKEYMNKIGIEY